MATGSHTKMAKFGYVVFEFEICKPTDRQTDRQTDNEIDRLTYHKYLASHPGRHKGEVIDVCILPDLDLWPFDLAF